MNRADVLKNAAQKILDGEMKSVKELIQIECPFKKLAFAGRNYTDKQKMKQFKKDAFIKKWHKLSVL